MKPLRSFVTAGAITFVRIFSLNGTNFRTLYLLQRMNRRCKNVAARNNNIASSENPDFIDHCGRAILYGSYGGRIQNMVIETVLFIAFVVTAAAAIVKAYEGCQDVLYGPYMKRVD